jgi:hypothetical protein
MRGQNVRRTDICNGNGRRGRRHYRNNFRDDVSRSHSCCNALLSRWGGSLRTEQRGPQALEADTVCAHLVHWWGLLRGTASEIIAALINAALSHLSPPVAVKVSPAIGALAASTVSVTVLLRVLKRSKTGDLPGLKGEE